MKAATLSHLDAHIVRNRPNRVALGMTATNIRRPGKQGQSSRDVMALVVDGTTDPLAAHAMGFWRKRVTCHCCGQAGKQFALSDSGRAHLARLRNVNRVPVQPVKLP